MTSSSSSSSGCTSQIVQDRQAPETLPCILDGTFFIYSEKESTNTKKVATCTYCKPKEVMICGYNNSTSNFVTHLKRRHGEAVYKEYQSHLRSVKKRKVSSKTSNCRQSEIRDSSNAPAEMTVSQEQFNENLLNFFIHSMIPLQAIDDPFFKKIFQCFNITTKGLNVVSKRTLERLVDDYYAKEIVNIKTELHDVHEVCTTADIWSVQNWNFLCVTAHWLDSNLKRKSRTLACRRFLGPGNCDRLYLLLEAVHIDFGLNYQTSLITITYKSSNFVEAFKQFGIDVENLENFTNSNENFTNSNDNLDSEGSPIVKNIYSEDFVYLSFKSQLDPQIKVGPPGSVETVIIKDLTCSAHMLSICAFTGVNKVLRHNKTTIANVHDQVIKKCNYLWNLAGRPKSAKLIHNVVGFTFSKPDSTRWNSLYDAFKQIASIQDKSGQLSEALEMTNFLNIDDFQYINEYLRCSKPIVDALEILQGDQDTYYGILLPCLVSLRKKLEKLNRDSLTFCKKLVEKYLYSVKARFADIFDITEDVGRYAAVAAMSYPRFKDKWIVCVSLQDQSKIKSIFEDAVIEEMDQVFNNRYKDSYFEFDTDSSETNSAENGRQIQRSKANAIISQYLRDHDRDTSMLNRHPEIKRVFKKYNNPIPYWSAFDKLFSYDIMTNSPKSHRPTDEMFEKRVLLKYNLSIK